MASHPQRICPHLHISMQSGSDAVLRRMRRRWGAKRFVDRCRLVQSRLDRPAITTDVIVGFPGETEQQFLETCQVAEEVGFSKIHIFPFSPRRTTPAAAMPDQVPAEVKADRCRRLAELESRLQRRYFDRLRGMALQVLVQGLSERRPGHVTGTSCRYATVELPGDSQQVGQFAQARAAEVGDGLIVGR